MSNRIEPFAVVFSIPILDGVDDGPNRKGPDDIIVQASIGTMRKRVRVTGKTLQSNPNALALGFCQAAQDLIIQYKEMVKDG